MYDVMVLIGMQDLLRSDFHKRFMVSCTPGIAMNLLTRVVEIRPLSSCPTNARTPYSSQSDDYCLILESSIGPTHTRCSIVAETLPCQHENREAAQAYASQYSTGRKRDDKRKSEWVI